MPTSGRSTFVDLNQDGNLDAVVAISEGGIVRLDAFYGNGDGTFKASVSLGIVASNPERPGGLLAVDVNNDGNIDFVTSSNSSNIQPKLLLGNGDGTFRAAQTLPISHADGRTSINSADFNGDGNLDFAFNGKNILFGNGDGTFRFSSLMNLSDPITGIMGAGGVDFNNDGIADTAVTKGDASGDYTLVFLGNGDGTFSYSASIANVTSAYVQGTYLSVADVDGDGNDDIVRPTYGGAGNAQVYYGNGDGTFRAGVSQFYGAVDIALGDLNGDGVLDGVAFGGNKNIIRVSGTTTKAVSMAQRRWHIDEIDISSITGAREAVTKIGKREDFVHQYQGVLGAAMSRIKIAVANLQTQREGTEAARSRIVDADIAFESAEALRTHILQQTASAVLAQAKTQPQLALLLLKG